MLIIPLRPISRYICALSLLAGFTLCCFSQQPNPANPLDGIAVATSQVKDPIAYFNRKVAANRLVNAGKYSEAEPLVDDLVNQYPFNGDSWIIEGIVKRHLDKFLDAERAYRRAIELLGPGVPGNAEYWLAVSQLGDGDKMAALKTLSHLVMEDHYLHRPSLEQEVGFKALAADPRLISLAGHERIAHLNRNERWQHDVDYLVAEVKRVNPDYHKKSFPQTFDQQYRLLRMNIPKLSDEQIYVGMSRLLASLHQGHMGLWPFIPAQGMDFKALPIQLYLFPEGLFIVDALPPWKGLIGTKLVKVEDVQAMDALRRVGEIQPGDSGMEVAWLGPANLTLAQVLKGLGIAQRTDAISITTQDNLGKVTTQLLPTGPVRFEPKLHAFHNNQTSSNIIEAHKAHQFERLAEADAIYVQLNQVQDDPDETLEAFGIRLRKAIQSLNVHNAILDLRQNNGGNTYLYVELLRTLVAFSQGEGNQLYVLIGRGVYSAAANLTTDLERLASPIFVGEPTSMTGNNYGDESEVVLPYSGIAAGVAGVKWGLGYPYDARRSIIPQVPVTVLATDYFSGRDPVLDTAQNLCRRGIRLGSD